MFGKFMVWCGPPPGTNSHNNTTVDDKDVAFQPMMTAAVSNYGGDGDDFTAQKSYKTFETNPSKEQYYDDDDDDVIPPPVSPLRSTTDGDGSQTSMSSEGSSGETATYDDTLIAEEEIESTTGRKVISYYKRVGNGGGDDDDDDDSMDDDEDGGSKSTWFTYGTDTQRTAGGGGEREHERDGGGDDTTHNTTTKVEESVSLSEDDTTTTSCVTDILIKNPSTDHKLMFMLDEVHELARIGQNVTLKSDNILPDGVSKNDIYVDVAIDDDALVYDDDEEQEEEEENDEKVDSEEEEDDYDYEEPHEVATSKSTINRKMIRSVVDVISDDLSSVYCAESMEDAELVLCIVIVSLSGRRRVVDKSNKKKKSTTNNNNKKNKKAAVCAEIGLTWQLFEPDTLEVYGGGLITQRKDLSSASNNSENDDEGQRYLINNIAPRIASTVMSKLAGNTSNDELLVEV